MPRVTRHTLKGSHIKSPKVPLRHHTECACALAEASTPLIGHALGSISIINCDKMVCLKYQHAVAADESVM
jgi:hypothetical protein